MKTAITFIFIILFSLHATSQNLDLIVTNSNDSIVCKIDSITSSDIYYKMISQSGSIQIGMSLAEIHSYSFGTISEEMITYKNNVAKLINKDSYRYLKQKYRKMPYESMKTDKYNLGGAFILSLIPGFGHFYTGEVVRGLGFIGGMAGSFVAFGVGFSMAWGGSSGGDIIALAGAVGFVSIYIWNIFDAVQVAKIKNLAFRNNDISFKVIPNFEFSKVAYQPVNNFGVKLVLNF